MSRSFAVDVLLLLVYVAVSSFGLYSMKLANAVASPRFALGFAAYAAGFVLWIAILMRMPLSVAFPIAAGSLVIASQVVGAVFLNEAISAPQAVGAGLVLVGIALIYLRA